MKTWYQDTRYSAEV